MGFVVGPGVDDRDVALTHDVTYRTREGERARIVAENPPHAGSDIIDHAGLQREITVERDVVIVGHGVLTRDFRISIEFTFVMPGLVPGIHVFLLEAKTFF